MKKVHMLIVFLCIVIVSLLVWFLQDEPVITNYPPKNDIIVAFGDSLVFGKGSERGGGFVSLLSEQLGKDIINLGVSGDTTKDARGRVGEVLRHDPGIIIMLLGGNDFLRNVPEEETEQNLAFLIEQFHESGAVVVLLGVRGNLINDDRDTMYERLSEQYGTVYVSDVLKGVFLKPELMFDGIHPNDRGYTKIADRLLSVFEEMKLQ